MVFTCQYCLISLILSLVVMSMCTFIVCCRISVFCCALILCLIPGCQRRGRVPGPEVQHYTHCGPKGSDGLAASSAVRKPGGFRGPGILLSGTPLFAGLSAPHHAALHFPNVQSLPVEWMDVLRPRWDGVLVGVVMLWNRGTILLIGA